MATRLRGYAENLESRLSQTEGEGASSENFVFHSYLILLLLTEYFSANYDVKFGTQSFQISFHLVRAPSWLRAISVSDLALADRASIKNSKWPPHYTKAA